MSRGSYLPVSHFRRLVTDLMYFSAKVPSATIERHMELGRLVAARGASMPQPTWSAIFTKAYGFVSAARPELRRAFLPCPWPHLYEHPLTIASVAVERRYQDEEGVFFLAELPPLVCGCFADGFQPYAGQPFLPPQ